MIPKAPVSSLGIVAALEAEARALPAGVRARVVVSGPGRHRAVAAAEQLVREGCTALLSWGVAAGLRADLESGAVVIADGVCAEGVRGAGDRQTTPSDRAWCRALAGRCASLPRVRVGTVVGVERVVADPDEKRALAALGVIADMESAAVAWVARERGAAWLAVRAVVDPVGLGVPDAALAGMRDDGRQAPIAVLLALVARPTEIGALVGLGRRFSLARAGLRALGRAAGTSLALPGPRPS